MPLFRLEHLEGMQTSKHLNSEEMNFRAVTEKRKQQSVQPKQE